MVIRNHFEEDQVRASTWLCLPHAYHLLSFIQTNKTHVFIEESIFIPVFGKDIIFVECKVCVCVLLGIEPLYHVRQLLYK